MNSTVKFVFLMILGAVVAVLLYWIFFGTVTLGGTDTASTSEASGFYFKSHWDGILTYASRAIETPISAYYYYYCYLPTAYNNVYIDMELARDSSGSSAILDTGNYLDLCSLPSDLSAISTDLYNNKLATTERFKYSTGFN